MRLACLLLPSVTPATGAPRRSLVQSKLMTARRRELSTRPELPVTSPVPTDVLDGSTGAKCGQSLEKYEPVTTSADFMKYDPKPDLRISASNVLTPHVEDYLDIDVQQSDNSEWRFKRQPIPTTTNKSTTYTSTTLEEISTTTKRPAPPENAVVQSRSNLIHPAFTTYFFSVTVPCVIAWVLVTWLCLWICRPHSPLYRDILKRLIEHSQMKQKSVLFAATVLAGERKPPEELNNAESASAKK